MAHQILFPIIETVIAIIIVILSFLRYKVSKDKSALYWSIGFLFYSIYGFLTILLFVNHALQLNSFFHFFRQISVTLLFISVYFGIIKLLSKKKIHTFWLPITFLFFQVLVLIYGDFILNQPKYADTIHILFFDIPFNILIGILFFKHFSITKKRYSLLIGLGWIGYVIAIIVLLGIVPNDYIYILTSIPNFILLIGFIDFYNQPKTQTLFEIVPVIERTLSTDLKYLLNSGNSYIINEDNNQKSFDVFNDAINHGILGLAITRKHPNVVRLEEGIEKTPIIWLTQIESECDSLDPTEIEQIFYVVDKYLQDSLNVLIKKSEICTVPELDVVNKEIKEAIDLVKTEQLDESTLQDKIDSDIEEMLPKLRLNKIKDEKVVEEIKSEVKKCVTKPKSIILFDGFEYLMTANDFNKSLKVVQMLKDKISKNNSCLIVSVNSNTLTGTEYSQLKKELDEI